MLKIEEPDANNSHGSVRGLELPSGLELGVKFCSYVRNRLRESVMRRIVKLLFEIQAAIKQFGGWLATMSAPPRDLGSGPINQTERLDRFEPILSFYSRNNDLVATSPVLDPV
jgi:hypothetical protein